MKIKNNSIFIVNPKSTCREENDNTFTVYNPDTDVITSISPLCKAIFDLLDGKTNIAEIYHIIAEIYNEYTTDEGRIQFHKFVTKLLDRGILQEIQTEEKITV